MFKIGDKVTLNDKGVAMKYTYVKANQIYEVIGFESSGFLKLKGVFETYSISYSEKFFNLVKEKEMKKIKFDIEPATKEAKETFPCIREEKTSGRLYYFMNSYANGYPLHDNGSVRSFENTKPWTGTVAITQE